MGSRFGLPTHTQNLPLKKQNEPRKLRSSHKPRLVKAKPTAKKSKRRPRNYERHKMNTPNFKSSMLIALVILTWCAATSKPPSIVDAPQIQPPPAALM